MGTVIKQLPLAGTLPLTKFNTPLVTAAVPPQLPPIGLAAKLAPEVGAMLDSTKLEAGLIESVLLMVRVKIDCALTPTAGGVKLGTRVRGAAAAAVAVPLSATDRDAVGTRGMLRLLGGAAPTPVGVKITV